MVRYEIEVEDEQKEERGEQKEDEEETGDLHGSDDHDSHLFKEYSLPANARLAKQLDPHEAKEAVLYKPPVTGIRFIDRMKTMNG